MRPNCDQFFAENLISTAEARSTTTNQGALESLRVIPPGKEGEYRGSCASCGLYLWSEGGYRIPGLQGSFCSLVCIECAIAEKTGQTKKIPSAPIGNGARLLAYLKTEARQVYAKLAEGVPTLGSKRCVECGVSLDGKRSDSEFCSDVHRKRFAKSSTSANRRFIAETPIGKQGLTERQNAGSMNTLSRPIQGLETAISATSPFAEERA